MTLVMAHRLPKIKREEWTDAELTTEVAGGVRRPSAHYHFSRHEEHHPGHGPGRCHRCHPQGELPERDSMPGYERGPREDGRWSAVHPPGFQKGRHPSH